MKRERLGALGSAAPDITERGRSSPTMTSGTGVPSTGRDRWRSLHQPLFICFLLALAGESIRLFLRLEPTGASGWFDCVFCWLAALTTLVGLGRRLPAQNVVAVAGLVGAIAAAVEGLNAWVGLPFGSRRFLEGIGPRVFGPVPWAMPALWITVVVAGRGVARLIVRPYRKTTYYGFWVIGLAALLAVGFDLVLEPFAVHAARWWIWDTPAGALTWHTAPPVNSLGWLTATLLILCFATPWLLNKQPVKQPTDFHPLTVWLSLQLLFAAGNAAAGHWSAVALGGVLSVAACVYAFRGAR